MFIILVELGFVISKTAKKIKKENYLDYIEAYFICLDLTDRSFQQESKVNGWPWFYSKGQDSFLPISRFIERSKVIDPHNLELTLFINNQVRQQDNTGNMHYKIGETLEHLSYYVTLNKGDLILTGTPSGIGAISVGDKLLAQLKQDDKILVEMKYDVIEEEKEKEILPKF
jgi:acylpyruvate hydrolase